LSRFFNDEAMQKANRAVTESLIIGMAKAMTYTPIDKGLLINSSFRDTRREGRKIIGTAGYTQAYAAALHDNMNWRPKRPGTPGKPRGGYNPSATPKFLEKGFEETEAQQRAAVIRIMRV
jgi:hypothetical protein